MTMETVDLSDVNSIVQQTTLNDNNDKGPVSLEQIHIEESEERWRRTMSESDERFVATHVQIITCCIAQFGGMSNNERRRFSRVQREKKLCRHN